jgi:hypothetical protein
MLPGKRINITHHSMKGDRTPLQNIAKGVHVSLVDIQEGIERKFRGLVVPSTPFVEGRIELIF